MDSKIKIRNKITFLQIQTIKLKAKKNFNNTEINTKIMNFKISKIKMGHITTFNFKIKMQKLKDKIQKIMIKKSKEEHKSLTKVIRI